MRSTHAHSFCSVVSSVVLWHMNYIKLQKSVRLYGSSTQPTAILTRLSCGVCDFGFKRARLVPFSYHNPYRN